MKKEIQYIDAAKFEEILKKLNVEHFAQAGYVKIPGPKGYAMYVAKTKRVGRVDISGFCPDNIPGVTKLDGDDSFGRVQAQLDFTQDPDVVLKAFEKCVRVMEKLEPIETVSRRPAANRPQAQGWSESVPMAADRAPRKKGKSKAGNHTTAQD